MRADGAARGGANWVKTRCVGHGAYARPRMHAFEGGGVYSPKRAEAPGVHPPRAGGRGGAMRARGGGPLAPPRLCL
jgi:hypothetical protein